MANSYLFSMTSKRAIISLRCLSHEVCVAVTQEEYWKKLTHNSNISIISQGIYVPQELEQFCNDNDEPRLQLIIQSQSEQDNQQFDDICAQIRRDLKSFENRDHPVFDPQTRDVVVYGSLFNSLPPDIFDTDRNLLGQRNCNIKKIRNSFGSSIYVDQSIPQRYKFTIHHENQTIMDLTAIQLQALVRQTQDQYVIAFATKRGRSLIEPIAKTEVASSSSSSSNPNDFPSFTSFQHSTSKRKRNDDEEQQQQQTTTNQNVFDSDQSDNETVPEEER